MITATYGCRNVSIFLFNLFLSTVLFCSLCVCVREIKEEEEEEEEEERIALFLSITAFMRDECLFARFFVVRIYYREKPIQLFLDADTERNIPKKASQARKAKKKGKNRGGASVGATREGKKNSHQLVGRPEKKKVPR